MRGIPTRSLRPMHLSLIRLVTAVIALTLVGCERSARSISGPLTHPGTGIETVKLSRPPKLNEIIPRLAEKRVVFIGENHDRYDHHLAQLEIIRRLHTIHGDLALGLEYFQTPFQHYLDDYVDGTIDEKTLLKATQYFTRWRFDYRLYRPILQYARDHKVALVALNIPTEISRKVARTGLESLNAEERTQVAQHVDYSDNDYRQRLRHVFELHRQHDTSLTNFDYFVQAQLLWDESMAETAVRYLQVYPDQHMVILAGSGHIAYGSGIPRRLERRLAVATATVINVADDNNDPAIADFLLFPAEKRLPPAGILGIAITQDVAGVAIDGLLPDSGASKAGLRKGDVFVTVRGERVATLADIKLALLDKRPGDRVKVMVQRSNSGGQLLEFNVALSSYQR
ncbi:MAG: ChaN family lipoprotein [Acidiferrobacterales bacterium]